MKIVRKYKDFVKTMEKELARRETQLTAEDCG